MQNATNCNLRLRVWLGFIVGKGRPARGRTPDFYLYRVTGALASRVQEHQRRLERKSGFILATNLLDETVLSEAELIAAYKDQQTSNSRYHANLLIDLQIPFRRLVTFTIRYTPRNLLLLE